MGRPRGKGKGGRGSIGGGGEWGRGEMGWGNVHHQGWLAMGWCVRVCVVLCACVYVCVVCFVYVCVCVVCACDSLPIPLYVDHGRNTCCVCVTLFPYHSTWIMGGIRVVYV